MKIIHPQVNGNQVIYDVTTENFTELVAIQYSIAYDTNILSYVGVQNILLPDMNQSNFYNPMPGAIINVWIDLNLEGATLANGTIIYQLVFDMKQGTYGGVCFAQDPVESEFVQFDIALPYFTIVDDCHPDPFQIDLTTSTEEIADQYGLKVFMIAHSKKIDFSLSDQQALAFKLFDLSGRQVAAFPKKVFTAGEHSLAINASILPGIYILTTTIQDQPVALKIFFQQD
jgi:hypothetical protein